MDVAEDIVFQILLRLPVLSLLRFRCVCKQWCWLINSPIFKDAYLALRRAMPVDDEIFGIKVKYEEYWIDKIYVTGCYSDYESFILESASAPRPASSNDFEIPAWTPPPPLKRPGYRTCKGLSIIGHVNGLICVQGGENWVDIMLINPALREYRFLPPVTTLEGFKFDDDIQEDVGFGYRYRRPRFPKCALQGLGFGFDDVNDDYKVVAIVTLFDSPTDFYESPYKHIGIVYRLSTDSWTILGDMSGFIPECYKSEPYFMTRRGEGQESIFSHGAIHWCIGVFQYYPVLAILAFNTSTELFRVIQFPHGWTSYTSYGNTQGDIFPFLYNVDKSTIALVGMKDSSSYHPLIEVWVMKQYGDSESWTKQHSIRDVIAMKALSFWEKDKLLLIAILEEEGYVISCYDLLKGRLCEQRVHPWADGNDGWEIKLVTGHESFVSVKPVSNQD